MPEGGRGPLPELGANALEGYTGEAQVQSAVLERGHLYSRYNGLDFGVDGIIELVVAGKYKQASGRYIGVQVKRGLSVVKKTRFGLTLYFNEQHANYWLGHSLPIIIVYCDPINNQLRWRQVRHDTLRKTQKGYAIDLPEKSDLRIDIDSLQTIAEHTPTTETPISKTLVIPISFQNGILLSDEEIGLAALELSRASIRGETCRVEVLIEEEADLIASIDAINDIINPSAEDRREAIIRADILSRYRKDASKISRSLNLLLTLPEIASIFGYDHQLMAVAVRRAASDRGARRPKGEVGLQAWPTSSKEWPVVGFDIPSEALDDFYSRDDMNRFLIRAGTIGGTMISDLPLDIVGSRFLPALVRCLVDFADQNQITDRQALDETQNIISCWLIGLA